MGGCLKIDDEATRSTSVSFNTQKGDGTNPERIPLCHVAPLEKASERVGQEKALRLKDAKGRAEQIVKEKQTKAEAAQEKTAKTKTAQENAEKAAQEKVRKEADTKEKAMKEK